VADEVRSHFGAKVLKTAIPRSVRVSEAPSFGQTVLTYDPGSTGALCYLEAARELAQNLGTATPPPAPFAPADRRAAPAAAPPVAPAPPAGPGGPGQSTRVVRSITLPDEEKQR